MISVFIFDDNKRTIDAVEALLSGETDINLVGFSTNTSDLITKLTESKANLVIMDIDMPGTNGIESTKTIKSHFPDIQVLMQTVHDDENKIFESVCAGASGYILKGQFSANLANCIRECYNGGCPMSPSVSRKVFGLFSKLSLTEELPKGANYSLTSKEKEVLTLMVEGKSIKMLSEKLNISYETGKTHVKHIYNKLHVASRSEAVAKAIFEKLI